MNRFRIFLVILLIIDCETISFGQVYLKDILYNGNDEKPHKVYTRSEMESADFDGYSYDGLWVIKNNGKSIVIDNDSFWGLMDGNFYKFYHNARIDLSSPLKQKVFEKSEEYAKMKEEMDLLMSIVREDSFHLSFECMEYDHEYDLGNGGFDFEFEKPSGFPIITYASNPPTGGPLENGAPKYSAIYDSKVKNIIKEYQPWEIKFFVPIANEDVALGIENTRDEGYYLDEIEYGFLMKCKYKEDSYPAPVIVIEDIILVRTSDNQVVWSATLGDLSDNLK